MRGSKELSAFATLPEEIAPSGRVGQLVKVARASPKERSRLGEIMDAYLRTHPTTAGWRDNRLRLRDTPHFTKYRTKQHDARYEGAVHALSAGTATADDLELARALGAEIAASPLIIRVRAGLAYGRDR